MTKQQRKAWQEYKAQGYKIYSLPEGVNADLWLTGPQMQIIIIGYRGTVYA